MLLFYFLLLSSCCALADTIYVHNRTDLSSYPQTVFVAGYIQPHPFFASSIADLTDGPIAIEPGQMKSLGRRDLKFFEWFSITRMLFFSYDKNDLKQFLTAKETPLVGYTGATTSRGTSYYIYEEDGVLRGADELEWKVILPILQAGKNVVSKVLEPLVNTARKDLDRNNPYKHEKATVIKGTDIPQQERDFIALYV